MLKASYSNTYACPLEGEKKGVIDGGDTEKSRDVAGIISYRYQITTFSANVIDIRIKLHTFSGYS